MVDFKFMLLEVLELKAHARVLLIVPFLYCVNCRSSASINALLKKTVCIHDLIHRDVDMEL